MKPLSALYLLYVLFTTGLGALIATGTLSEFSSAPGPSQHPLLVGGLHLAIFAVLFLQGLIIHFRVPGSGIIFLVLLGIVSALAYAVHLLK